MKKILSIVLAMLMLALPVFGGAEIAEETEAGFLLKYQEQGQKLTSDISIEPGELLASLLGENAAAIQDLLSALGIQVTVQTDGSNAQFGLNLSLNGSDALVTLLAAATENGLVIRSNLVGEDTYAASSEELQNLLTQYTQSMGDQGSALNNLLTNPEEALAGVEVDPSGLMEALTPIMSNVTVEEVTEAPDAFPEAKTVTVVSLKKEDLSNVMTELAKMLWSIPALQQAFSLASSGTPVTEESLTQSLTSIPAAMKEDAELRIYANEAQDETYSVCDVILDAGDDKEAIIQYSGRTSDKPEGNSQSHRFYVIANDVYTNISVTAYTAEHSVTYTLSADQTSEGVVTQAYDFSFSRDVNKPDDKNETVKMDIAFRAQTDPSSNPVGITVSSETTSKDLDDHGESTNVLTVGMEGMGTLVTIHTVSVTGPADAYITDEGAIHPLAMSQEELNELAQKLMTTLQTNLMGIMQQLPSSVLQMVMPASTSN